MACFIIEKITITGREPLLMTEGEEKKYFINILWKMIADRSLCRLPVLVRTPVPMSMW